MKIIDIKDSFVKSLSKVKRKKVFFDTGEVISIPIKVFYYHKLKRGMVISQEKYEKLLNDIFEYEWSYTVRWLSRKDRSSEELEQKLKNRDVSKNIIEKIVEKTHEYNYVNDSRVKENLIRELYEKGYGPNYIKKKLSEKGLIYEENDFLNYDFYKSCLKEYNKKKALYKKKKNGDILILNYLTRRGFSYDIIKEIIKGVDDE